MAEREAAQSSAAASPGQDDGAQAQERPSKAERKARKQAKRAAVKEATKLELSKLQGGGGGEPGEGGAAEIDPFHGRRVAPLPRDPPWRRRSPSNDPDWDIRLPEL